MSPTAVTLNAIACGKVLSHPATRPTPNQHAIRNLASSAKLKNKRKPYLEEPLLPVAPGALAEHAEPFVVLCVQEHGWSRRFLDVSEGRCHPNVFHGNYLIIFLIQVAKRSATSLVNPAQAPPRTGLYIGYNTSIYPTMQYFYSFLLCLLATTQVTGVAPEAAISLTVEYSDAPLGLDAARPVRVSWKIAASPSTRGVLQNRYRTSVAAWPAPADGSGWRYAPWMTSNRSQLVPLDGFTPAAGSLYTVQVEVDTGGPTTGTAQAVLGTVPDLSTASFIGAADLGLESCPWMRKSFSLSDWAAPDRAVVHIASYGYHDLFVNGKPVGKDVLSPSVSDLGKRVLVRSYDVSAYLSSGNNTLGLWLGAGWAQFSTVNPAKADFFNTTKAPLALAVLQFHPHASAAAGAAFPPDIVTDATWKVKPSSVTHLGRYGLVPGNPRPRNADPEHSPEV